MGTLLTTILIGWGVGMAGVVGLGKIKKYNNRQYYDMSDRLITYKKIREKTNINKK